MTYEYTEYWNERGKTDADIWNDKKQFKVLKILSELKYNTVLELGCGNGEFSKLLKESDCVLTGLDISENRTRKNPYLDYTINQNILNIDIDKKFDLVCCSHFLLHINPKDISVIIEKIKFLSKKNILFIEPYPNIDLGKWEYYNFKYIYDELMNKKSMLTQIDKNVGAYLYD